ncbi:MAG: DnaJ domain-containing protein [Alphaproteobacteria bacterium]|nr:DnaJ domain-containing protein [Alphaproteobacteria bacterium]MBO4643973.1 DnaJ domain-containing protein [Alphaproteobacteria bacterium]
MFADPLNIKAEAFHFEEGREKAFKSDKPQPLDPAVIVAAKILEVDFPLQKEEVRLNYKRLAKKYHPDSHGGSKELEERFKDITEAYRLIMSILDTDKE